MMITCVKCNKDLSVLEFLAYPQPYHIMTNDMITIAALIKGGLLPLCFLCVNELLSELK